MIAQSRQVIAGEMEEGFSRPVESIMRCEDFKSNFARRLSNRYISRPPVSTPKQDTALKLRPLDSAIDKDIHGNVQERLEQCSQLSKSSNMEQNGEAVKPPDKLPLKTTDVRLTEVTALNMEVETLRWQLAQTEANRQMHIALLRQIVSFLNRVKRHIQCQKDETGAIKEIETKALKRTCIDLPRSRSAVHVNKTLEYSLTPQKKISARKISKSISNVNGLKEYSAVWNQSKLTLTSETEASQKITEEISRLIILANTVLSTTLPELSCTCRNDDTNETIIVTADTAGTDVLEHSVTILNKNDETTSTLPYTDNNNADLCNKNTNPLMTTIEKKNNDYILSLAMLNNETEDELTGFQLNEKEQTYINAKNVFIQRTPQATIEKRNDLNNSNFIEDESGFSSMSSFQEIGIPIISIIPPSPCKEMSYMEDIPDILEDTENWKTDAIDIEKQTVKVFWV